MKHKNFSPLITVYITNFNYGTTNTLNQLKVY